MEKIIIEYFGAGCGNCKAFEPILTQIEGEHADIKFFKKNIDENLNDVVKYEVTTLPTLLFFKGDEYIDKLPGLKPKIIVNKKIAEVFANG